MLASFNYSPPSTGALVFAGACLVALHAWLFSMKSPSAGATLGAIFTGGICLVTLGAGKGDALIIALMFWGPVALVVGGAAGSFAGWLGKVLLTRKPLVPPPEKDSMR